MKSLIKGVFVVFAMMFLSDTQCFQQPQPSKSQKINLTDDDSGKLLNVLKGTVFTLTLPDHVDGGYRFDEAQYDTSILRLEKYTEKAPPPNSAQGRPGLAYWQFIAVKNGETLLKITATRPWNGGGSVTIFENIVLVK